MRDLDFLRRIAEEFEEEPKGKKPKGPPPGWDKFMKERYEGGKRKVSNPNPNTRMQFPQVSVGTAMKNDVIKKKVMQEYREWLKADKSPPKPQAPTKDEDKAPKKPKAPGGKKPKKPLYEQTSWVDANSPEWKNAWSNTLKALKDSGKSEHVNVYTGSAYKDINKSWRSGKPSALAKNVQEAVKSVKVPQAVKVSRSIGTEDPLYKALMASNLLSGDHVSFSGILSTSIKDAKTWDFNGSGVNIVFHVPKGHSGVWVGDPPSPALSEYPHEKELVLPHGTSGKVHKIEKDGDKTFVHILCDMN